MEAVSLSPSLTASSFGTSAAEKRGSATIACLSYAPSNNLNVRHLAAFHKQSHLFTKSPIRPFPSTKSRVRKSGNGNGIFLPHLVASLVCFLIFSFSCCNWNALFFFSVWSLCVLTCPVSLFLVQEQVEQTYIMVKPDGVQRALVSFAPILLKSYPPLVPLFLVLNCLLSIRLCAGIFSCQRRELFVIKFLAFLILIFLFPSNFAKWVIFFFL